MGLYACQHNVGKPFSRGLDPTGGQPPDISPRSWCGPALLCVGPRQLFLDNFLSFLVDITLCRSRFWSSVALSIPTLLCRITQGIVPGYAQSSLDSRMVSRRGTVAVQQLSPVPSMFPRHHAPPSIHARVASVISGSTMPKLPLRATWRRSWGSYCMYRDSYGDRVHTRSLAHDHPFGYKNAPRASVLFFRT
jgi:hypothetical protein